jgi:hypothetical protein
MLADLDICDVYNNIVVQLKKLGKLFTRMIFDLLKYLLLNLFNLVVVGYLFYRIDQK